MAKPQLLHLPTPPRHINGALTFMGHGVQATWGQNKLWAKSREPGLCPNPALTLGKSLELPGQSFSLCSWTWQGLW